MVTNVSVGFEASSFWAMPNLLMIAPYCQMVCSGSATSADGGKTWKTATWSGCPTSSTSSNAFNIVGPSFDGKTLIARCDKYPTSFIVTSRDGGAAWQSNPPIAAVPVSNIGSAIFNVVAPDGTLYVDATNPTTKKGMEYALTPGATAWTPSIQPGNELLAATWNSSGHLTSFWELSSKGVGLEIAAVN